MMSKAHRSGSGHGPGGLSDQHDQTWDAVETYFECITTCSLNDGDCITRCVEQLRDSDD
ncbi:hypothetical protein KR100_14315 [Synechococcus sp. KORDI-100]|nr:hypothetical protein KR100_14315 [Synechococcus sp. KORDI-100]